ncbi:hypothetical protein EWH08_11115 [Sphingobium indicum]|uniref:Uncharacterized protein n=2 Tax=Sphingobium indicum TaxID=332055 RepID=A0A1L5BSX7_SPHIB|nr:hypothetical protein [Sphingobium indicum]APL95974.1 hypothetical protein SIDU_16460 [Sphingobium indicum B90A]KEZ00066.1 hypothetical protein AI27_14625 [Sphingomonas sp. BHC-A]NYI23071.1 hypothetical protein [Sphingobium indicum]RYM01851.1 hypothetical protein EWH08_11115 [Sphingobium indicum]
MIAWTITPDHADLLASAYLELVDPSADPQDLGTALLADSLQGVQAGEGRKLAREWQAVEAYSFSRVPIAAREKEIADAVALVSDTARSASGWYETDTRRALAEIWETLAP